MLGDRRIPPNTERRQGKGVRGRGRDRAALPPAVGEKIAFKMQVDRGECGADRKKSQKRDHNLSIPSSL